MWKVPLILSLINSTFTKRLLRMCLRVKTKHWCYSSKTVPDDLDPSVYSKTQVITDTIRVMMVMRKAVWEEGGTVFLEVRVKCKGQRFTVRSHRPLCNEGNSSILSYPIR